MSDEATQGKTEQCPECKKYFSKRGLAGHFAFGHGKRPERPTPAQSREQPVDGSARERARSESAGAGAATGGDEWDDFISGKF